MSEMLRKLRNRVDGHLKPHRDIYGDDSPVVRMGMLILAEAEDIEAQMNARRVSTAEAHDHTGWSMETLQKYARAKLANQPVPAAWAGLSVDETTAGYVFVLGSIPDNPRAQ